MGLENLVADNFSKFCCGAIQKDVLNNSSPDLDLKGGASRLKNWKNYAYSV